MTDRPRNAVWDDDPEGYDQLRGGWLNERRLQFVLHALTDAAPGTRVLELGSGTGWLLRRLARARPDLTFDGIDPLERYVAYATRAVAEDGLADRVAFVHGTAEDLGRALLPGPSPSWVLSNDVLHHVDDVPSAVRATTEACAPDAAWLAIEPNPRNPYVVAMHTVRPGETVFRARSFLAATTAAGWQTSATRTLFLVPPQVRHPPAWARAAERRLEHLRPLGGGLALTLRRGR